MSKLSTAIYFVEMGLAASEHPDFVPHQEAHLRGKLAPGLKRMSAMALFHTALRYPRLIGGAYDGILGRRDPNLELAGAGSEATVYRHGARIIKIHRGTSSLTNGQREQVRAEKESGHAILRKCLGSIVIDQQVVIRGHPLNTRRQTVQTIQPLCTFDKAEIFKPHFGQVNPEAVLELCQQYPGLDSALKDFLTGAAELRDQGYLPDINGLDNLVVGTIDDVGAPTLRLIDTTPLPVDMSPAVTGLVNSQLASLDNALQEIA